MSSESGDSMKDWCVLDQILLDKELSEADVGGKRQERPNEISELSSNSETTTEKGCSNISSEHSDEQHNDDNLCERDHCLDFLDKLLKDEHATMYDQDDDQSGKSKHEIYSRKRDSSSSDISVIDEELDAYVGDTSQSINQVALHSSFGFRTRELNLGLSSSSFHMDSSYTTYLQNKISAGFMTGPAISCRQRRNSSFESSFWDYDIHVEINVFQLILMVVFLCMGIAYFHKYPPLPPHDCVSLIEVRLLQCLGKRNLQAFDDQSTVLKLSPVCAHNSKEWHDVEHLLRTYPSVLIKLSEVQEMMWENETDKISKIFGIDMKHINIKLIIQNLEHHKMLPQILGHELYYKEATYHAKSVDDDLKIQLQKAIGNLTTLNENMQVYMEHMAQQQNGSSCKASGECVKDPAHQRNDTKINATTLLNSLEDKVQMLVLQNEKLKMDIYSLKTDPKTAHDYSLVNQIKLLQDSLEDKFKKVEDFYDFIQVFKAELEVLPPFDEEQQRSSAWTWHNLKVDVEKFFQEKRDHIKQTLDGYKNIDVTDTLNAYVQDGKKHAENTLNLVSEFAKVAKEKTKQMCKIDVKKTVDGVWNMWGAIQNKWTDMKHKFEDMAGKIPTNNAGPIETDPLAGSLGSKESKKSPSKDSYKGNNDVNDWFFKRATLREAERSCKMPVNWYLYRQLHRERARKECFR